MAVESEYRLQTREGARWTHEFNRRRTAALNDDERINSKRAELLRDGTKQALKPVSLQQGTSRQPRKLVFELSSSRPPSSSDEVTLWVRDGWSEDEKSVLNDARAAGVDSPLLFGYLPRLHHEELRQAVASHVAAQETLDAHGPAGGPEAIEARKAVETHLEVARHRIQELLGHVIGGAKVFLGGGQEANGVELADKVQDSATNALERLFPHQPPAPEMASPRRALGRQGARPQEHGTRLRPRSPSGLGEVVRGIANVSAAPIRIATP